MSICLPNTGSVAVILRSNARCSSSMENHAFDVKSGVDIDNISCNCSCIVAGQQKGRASKLLGINRSPEWRPSLCLVQKFIEMLDPGCRACPYGPGEMGRASGRERVWWYVVFSVVAVYFKKKKIRTYK